MQPFKNMNKTELKKEGQKLFKSSLITYLVLTLLALVSLFFQEVELNREFLLGSYLVDENILMPELSIIARFILICVSATLAIALVSTYFETTFPRVAVIKNIISAPLSSLSTGPSIILCFLSAVSEELFFRVTAVPHIGVFGAAAFYALVHLSPSGIFSMWTLEVIIVGYILGYIFDLTGSFGAILTIHFLVNIFSLYRYKSQWNRHGSNAFLSGFNKNELSELHD